MSVQDFLPQGQVWLVWLVQALLAAGLIALLSGLIVRVVSPIPVVGPVLAAAVRMLFSNYEKWLSERVPKLAEQAVLATEEKWRKVGSQYDPAARAQAKLQEAIEALQQMAPGLPRDIAQKQIEAALARIRAMGMEQKVGGGK
ncbi:hypothetical protein TTHN1_01593 [Thermus thermophilus]|uniref:Uncharacterized protein n=1 Tax=Thermus thermophilus TaxID=274 RepID=A0A3P4ARN4_THETH|nr:hypothetical protein [Thermus thermophilus]VCU53807.1 hypothetical protein TTHN1_01593 [Thermus thermophilus]